MNLPPVDEVINALESSTADFTIDGTAEDGLSSEQLTSLNGYRKDLLLKIAKLKQLNSDLLLSIAQAVEFVPFSTHELLEFIDEDEGSDEIYECIYNDSAAFSAEGIIDRCVANAAGLLNLEGFEASFVFDNRDEIIEECIALDGYEGDDDHLLSASSVYTNPVCYVSHWIRIAVTEYLKYDLDEANSWFEEHESLLEPYYQVMTKLINLGIN